MDKAGNIEEVFQQLRRIVHALDTFSRTVEGSFGLTAPQLWALWELGHGDPLSLKDLAARMQLNPSTVVGVVDRLELKKLILRKQDSADRRRVCISLTRAGESLRAKAPHPAQGQLLHGLQAMSASEVREFHRILGKLVKVMEADGLDAQFFFKERD